MSYTGFTGQIILFAGNYTPQGWLPCDGRTLSISDYQPLYSLIGTTYGSDNASNFKLPDLRGRIPVGAGQHTNLANHDLGGQFGSELHTLSTNEMPAHQHILEASTQAATATTPQGNVLAALPTTQIYYFDIPATATQSFSLTLSTNTVQIYGGNQPYDLRAPVRALTYLICPNGIYPTRS